MFSVYPYAHVHKSLGLGEPGENLNLFLHVEMAAHNQAGNWPRIPSKASAHHTSVANV